MTDGDDYTKVKGRIRRIRPNAILFTVGESVPRGEWIPRSLIHGADERLLDGLIPEVARAERSGGLPREIRIFTWKAEEAGFTASRDQNTCDLFEGG